MGIFQRLASLVSGKANDAVDNLENNNMDTVIRQSIREMEDELAQAIKSSAAAMAAANQIKKQHDDLKRAAKEWEGKAKTALSEGREDLAEECLVKVESFEQQAKDVEPSVKNAQKQCEILKKKITDRKAQIEREKNEGKILIARNDAAEAQKKLASAASGLNSEGAAARLEKFKNSVNLKESEAAAWEDLNGSADSDLNDELNALSSTSSVKDRMEALKAKMNK